MKSAVFTVLLGVTAVSLAGCGSTMRDYLEKETPAQNSAVRGDLTMPPDLRLPEPGTTAPAPDYSASSASTASQASLTTPPPAEAAPAKPAKSAAAPAAPGENPADSVYVQAGISTTNPDGTRKSDDQLRKELQEYYIAQKKAKNPNYGTVFNIGNIFKDE